MSVNNLSGKCPKCEKPLRKLEAKVIPIESNTKKFDGVIYCCPYCDTIISAAIDPVLLANQIIRAVDNRL